MNTHFEPGFDEVAQVLSDFGAVADAAEVHGHFCGLACMLGEAAGPLWATTVLADAATDARPGLGLQAVLESLAATSWRALEAGDMSLRLLLPPDERGLAERADSIGHWCAGFLHGLGSGDSSGRHSAALRSGATADILEDFTELTRASFDGDEPADVGEAAYAELVEFVRVSVQLVFEELVQIRSRPADGRTH